MQCPYSRQVWFECLVAACLNIVKPSMDNTLRTWWDVARELVHKKDMKWFDTLAILTAWTMWKQMNAKAFNNTAQQRNVQQIVRQIKYEFELWKLAWVERRLIMPRE
jgi:hypothetical protein